MQFLFVKWSLYWGHVNFRRVILGDTHRLNMFLNVSEMVATAICGTFLRACLVSGVIKLQGERHEIQRLLNMRVPISWVCNNPYQTKVGFHSSRKPNNKLLFTFQERTWPILHVPQIHPKWLTVMKVMRATINMNINELWEVSGEEDGGAPNNIEKVASSFEMGKDKLVTKSWTHLTI